MNKRSNYKNTTKVLPGESKSNNKLFLYYLNIFYRDHEPPITSTLSKVYEISKKVSVPQMVQENVKQKFRRNYS